MLANWLWDRAQENDDTLRDKNQWPEKLTLSQIAKQLFPDKTNDRERTRLIGFMNKQVENGSLEFDDIHIYPRWDYPSNVSISYPIDMFGIFECDRNYRDIDRENYLLEMHRPVYGWVEALKKIGPDNSIKLEQHTCGCDVNCTILGTYRNGLPKRWKVEGNHEDGQKISFSCSSEPVMTAKQSQCFFNAINQTVPIESTLNEWWKDLEMQSHVGAKNEVRERRTRQTNLTRAIHAAFKTFSKKPSFDEFWQFFQDDKDETGFIVDFTETHLMWMTTRGKILNTGKTTIQNHLSRIKS